MVIFQASTQSENRIQTVQQRQRIGNAYERTLDRKCQLQSTPTCGPSQKRQSNRLAFRCVRHRRGGIAQRSRLHLRSSGGGYGSTGGSKRGQVRVEILRDQEKQNFKQRGRGRYEPGIGRVQAINARMLPDDYLLSSSVRVIMDDFKDTPTRQASQPIFSNLDFPRSGRV